MQICNNTQYNSRVQVFLSMKSLLLKKFNMNSNSVELKYKYQTPIEKRISLKLFLEIFKL